MQERVSSFLRFEGTRRADTTDESHNANSAVRLILIVMVVSFLDSERMVIFYYKNKIAGLLTRCTLVPEIREKSVILPPRVCMRWGGSMRHTVSTTITTFYNTCIDIIASAESIYGTVLYLIMK